MHRGASVLWRRTGLFTNNGVTDLLSHVQFLIGIVPPWLGGLCHKNTLTLVSKNAKAILECDCELHTYAGTVFISAAVIIIYIYINSMHNSTTHPPEMEI